MIGTGGDETRWWLLACCVRAGMALLVGAVGFIHSNQRSTWANENVSLESEAAKHKGPLWGWRRNGGAGGRAGSRGEDQGTQCAVAERAVAGLTVWLL